MELYRKAKLTATALLMALVLVLSACTQAPLRLHIMANSDSSEDQQIKLTVRDAVLELTHEELMLCENKAQARAYIEENLETIQETANTALLESGFDYSADANVGVFHFPEKTYQDVTYPQGDYEALRITLGEGEGQNWWCVMFPPLCITEMEATDEEVEYTSLFAEFFQSLRK